MSEKRYPVSITVGESTQQYSESFQTEQGYSKQWKAVLQKAHKNGAATCLCPGSNKRRLSVRYRSKQDAYHLSRFPYTGAEHSLDCLYYSPAPEKSGLGSYGKGVVEEGEDGDLKLKLTLSLKAKDPAERKVPPLDPGAKSSAGRPTKPAMTALGLLHLLWTEAGLNRWSPGMAGKRSLSRVHGRLQHAASKMLASRMRIEDALLASTGMDGDQAAANRRKVASAIKHERRLLVIAPLAGYSEERELGLSQYLAIVGFHGIPRVMLGKDVWDATAQRYRRELAGWRQGRRVIAIVQTDQPVTPNKVQGLNVALMVVSDEWIPVDSSYEAVIEARLRDQERTFVKPLRYDSSEEQVFPDFWLMDVGRGVEFPLEVFGRQDPAYLARKKAKRVYYNETYGPDGWWYWDASSDPDALRVPIFPAIVK